MQKTGGLFAETRAGIWIMRWGVRAKDRRVMDAIDTAKRGAFADIKSDRLRGELADKLVLSCVDGREFPFSRLAVVGVGENSFYRERAKLAREVLRELMREGKT